MVSRRRAETKEIVVEWGVERKYRIVSRIEAPLTTFSDLMDPKAIYTLMSEGEQVVRSSLPRRSDWELGIVVKIDEDVVRENLVE